MYDILPTAENFMLKPHQMLHNKIIVFIVIIIVRFFALLHILKIAHIIIFTEEKARERIFHGLKKCETVVNEQKLWYGEIKKLFS